MKLVSNFEIYKGKKRLKAWGSDAFQGSIEAAPMEERLRDSQPCL